MFTSVDEIYDSLLAEELSEGAITPAEARVLANAARPSLWLRTTAVEDEALIPRGATKIGGRPDLPAGTPWPMRPAYPDAERRSQQHKDEAATPDSAYKWTTPDKVAEFRRDFLEMSGVVTRPFPLQFVAQFNFAELAKVGLLDPDLPRSGLLSIFWDTPEFPERYMPEADAGAKVLFHDDAPSGTLVRLDAPTELTALIRYDPFAPTTCEATRFVAPVPVASAAFAALKISDDARTAYREWLELTEQEYSNADGQDCKCHRVGGWPTPQQGDMQMESALVSAGHYLGTSDDFLKARASAAAQFAQDWIFVAQVGSDKTGDIMWGDAGQLYVWVKRSDLIARDFSRARVVVQSG